VGLIVCNAKFQVKFQVSDSPEGLVTIYEAIGSAGTRWLRQTVDCSLRSASASTYSLVEDANGAGGNNKARELGGDATMIPFAGSDFWVADLGLEFLHWPKQLLLRREMRRSGRATFWRALIPSPRPVTRV
jgi:hypothetical protein